MKCPYCGYEGKRGESLIVVDSRPYEDRLGTAVRRRRECGRCNKRWTTMEYVAGDPNVSALHELRMDLMDAQEVAVESKAKINTVLKKLDAILRGKDI